MLTTRACGKYAYLCCLLMASFWVSQSIADEEPADAPAAADLSPQQKAFREKLASLHWVKGPATVGVVGNSRLDIPAGYVFLNQADTKTFLELNQNLSDGSEMMIAPHDLRWSAYFSFADEGYVKDDEKIDGPSLLKSLQEGTEAINSERKKRGWDELHVVGWALPPAYNSSTKRLEWATELQSRNGRSVNFFTKILGRRGHTTVVLASSPDDLKIAEPALNSLLLAYRFNGDDTYADYRPGDKVAEYGLAALVLGGAAAIAAKKGLWPIIAGFFAAAWKFILAGVVALGAWVRRLFGKSKV